MSGHGPVSQVRNWSRTARFAWLCGRPLQADLLWSTWSGDCTDRRSLQSGWLQDLCKLWTAPSQGSHWRRPLDYTTVTTEIENVTSFYGYDFQLVRLEAHLKNLTANYPKQDGEIPTMKDIISYFTSLSPGHRSLMISVVDTLMKLILVTASNQCHQWTYVQCSVKG